MTDDDDRVEGAPFGVKLLVCFLLADAVQRAVELVHGGIDFSGGPHSAVFVLWALIDLLLGLLVILRTRAGRYWTQAILAVHVFYLAYTLALDKPHLWLVMSAFARVKVAATFFADGIFVGYLSSQQARAYLDEGP